MRVPNLVTPGCMNAFPHLAVCSLGVGVGVVEAGLNVKGFISTAQTPAPVKFSVGIFCGAMRGYTSESSSNKISDGFSSGVSLTFFCRAFSTPFCTPGTLATLQI